MLNYTSWFLRSEMRSSGDDATEPKVSATLRGKRQSGLQSGEMQLSTQQPEGVPQQCARTAQQVLEEDEYTQKLEELVEHAYFPDLRTMHSQLQQLRGYTPVRTPGSHIATAASVPGAQNGGAGQCTGDAEDSTHSHAGPAEQPARGGSLDSFVQQCTGEDNASFAEVIEKEKERHRNRLHSRGLSLPSSGLYSTPAALPAPKPENAQHMRERVIYPRNTTLHASNSPLDMLAGQQTESELESETSSLSKPEQLQHTAGETSNQRSLVHTPSMSPTQLHGGEPPITYGRLAQTPQRLDNGDSTPARSSNDADDDDMGFRVQSPSERERTGRRLAPKVHNAPVASPVRTGERPSKRRRHSAGNHSQRSSPASASRLSPAGKQLLRRIATPPRNSPASMPGKHARSMDAHLGWQSKSLSGGQSPRSANVR